MAASDDFRAQISAELDLSKIEQQIDELNNKKITLQVEVDQNSGKRLAESIQRGLKDTKVKLPDMATQLADSFNIKNPKIVSKIKTQVSQMAAEMAKAFDGNKINGANLGAGFDQAFNGLSETLAKNTTNIKTQMTDFYKSFYDDYKNIKVYISDAMKDAMGSQYDDIAKSGRIVRDAAKGVNLNEIWDEMSAAHPDILNGQLSNDVDQVFAFIDAMKAAKNELKTVLSFDDLDIDLQNEIISDAATSVAGIANQIRSQLEQSIGSAAEQLKSEFLLDVTVNQEKLMADIRQAIQQSAGAADNPIDVTIEINHDELRNKIQSAIQGISAENIPIQIDENEIRNNIHSAIQGMPLEEILVTIDDAQLRAEIQRVVGGMDADINLNIDRSQIESELRTALSGVDFPIDFRIDADDLRDQIRQAIAGMNDLEVDVNVNITNLQNSLRQGIQTLPTQDIDFMDRVNRAGREGQDVFSALGSTFRDAFSAYTMANLLERGVDMISDAGREAIQVVKDLNDACTDLMMATGESRSAVKEMINGYRDLGNDLGSLTLDVASAADEWLRQGKSIEETTTLIKDSVILSKVGQLDTSQASEFLTSSANGYKVAVDDVEGIIDKLSSVDLAAAYDAGQLAEAMSKTATSADLAGVSMDRLIAMIATVGETTQKSASTVGNSFQTIFSRMRDIKAGNLSSIGEDGTIEDLSQVETTLEALGIKLRSSDGEFRNFQTVLDEVATSWNNWSSVQQAAVSKAFAGTRQQENFLVMMENYDKVLKYTEISENSLGMAQQKFQEAYLSSLEAKTNQLKNSLEELAADTITDEMYAGFLDVASAAADVARETDLIETAFSGLASGGATYALTHLIRLLRSTATEITALGGGLTGFTQLLMQHPAVLVAAGVTAVVGAVNMYQANIEKMVSAAREAGKSWDEQNTSIEANKEKIIELRTALDSGKLTEEEAYQAKSDLLDIQTQLTTSYEEQAQGIDLVNGEIETQISLLSQLSQKEAQQFLNENAAGNKIIKEEMEKTRKYGLGTFYNSDSEEEVAAIRQAIADVEAEYGDFIDFIEDENGAYVDITLNADASTSRDVLNALMTDLTAIEQQFGSSSLIDDMINNVSSALSDAKGVVEEYAADYEKIVNAEMIADEKLYTIQTPDGKTISKSASEWLKDYTDAVNDYNTAIASGDTSQILAAKEAFDEIKSSVDKILLLPSMQQYSDQFAEVGDQLNQAAIAAYNFKTALSDDGSGSYIQTIINTLKSNNMSDVDFKDALLTDGIQTGEDASWSMLYAAQDFGIISDAANATADDINNVTKYLVDAGVLISTTMDQTAEEVISTVDSMKTSISDVIKMQDGLNAAMASSVTATGLTTEEIENVTNAYKNLNGYDPEKLFERTANGVHLNTAEVRKLDEQLRQNTMTDFLQAVADKQVELNQAREQGLDTTQLENELSVLQQLASQYDGLTSAYQRWLDAKSGGEEGDMYRSVNDTMIERGKELYDAELYNSKEFRAIADFYSNQDLTNATAEQVKSAYEQALPAIEKYFTAGREGIDAFVTDMKQLSDAEGLGWVTELEDGSLSFNTGSDQEIADRLGIDVEAIQAIYRMMSEYVDGIVIGDTSGLNAFTSQVEAVQQKLSEMQQNGEISSSVALDYDVNEMSLDEITAKIEELKGERVEIDAETNPEAAQALDDLIAKTEQAYYFKLNVDTDGGLDKASSAINGIQQRISELSAENPVLSVSAIVNGDEQIQTLAEELASLPPEVQTTVGITTENVGNVSGIISQLAQNPESISVPVNYTKGSEPETVDAAEGIANFTLGTSPKEVPDATGVANFRLGTYPTSLPTLTQFIRRVEIDSEATGTMLSPAHAKGSVALPEDETALVNEMGQESRIHNGIWELLPPGMHVQKLDKGDIILSARQTADLLKSGKAHGIGKAYADGTAFSGMPAHSAGGWTIGGSNTSSGSNIGRGTTSNSNNNNSGNAITNTINRVTNAVTRNLETFQEWLEKLVDWVEVRIQRINDRIDLYTAQSENAIGYQNQNSLLARAQRWNDNLLRDQQAGRDRYLQQANQVTDEAIASHLLNGDNDTQRRARANTLIDRIQNGYIDINEYNENEREFITAYTEWYDRAVELNLAIEETIANQRDLEQQRFENIADEYDNIISLIEHRSNMINEQMSQNEAAGYVGSRAYYQLLSGDARERQQRLQEEQRLLADNLQRSMNQGYIQYGDERWYAMQDQLNQVSEELQSVNGELIDFNNNIRALEWEQFDRGQETISRLTDEFNFMIDLMSDEQLFDDMGQATNEGLATMGLHAGNYNVYMEQANEYAQEYQRIQRELAKDPYNTDLIERRNELLDLQQESIAAAEDEKQALRDLVQQGIDAELNSLQELIDKYKDALKSKKDLYDYQRDIADKTSEVSNLQKQINAFSMDTSEEGRLRLQQAQDALREAQENLQQTEYERYISDQEELLDNLYTEYEDVLNARLDNIDELVSTVIASTNENAATISATLQEQAANVNYTMTDAMNRVWNSNTANGNIVSEFSNNFSQATTAIQTTIDGILGDITRMYEHSDWEAVADIANILDESRNGSNPQITTASTGGGSNGTTRGNTGGNNTGGNGNGNGNNGNGNNLNGPVSGIKSVLKNGSKSKDVGELQKALNALGYKDQYGQKLKIDNWFGPRTEGALKKFQKAMKISATGKLDAATKAKFKAKGYAAGTDWVDEDEWAWTQEDGREIVVRPDGSMLTPLQKGSSVINNPTTEKLFALANNADAIQDMVNTSGSLMKSQQAAAAAATEKQIMQQIVTNNNQNVPQNVSLECNINLPNVYEPKDFMNWLMDSRSAQRALQDYVLGEAFGKANITTRSHKF